MIEALTVIGIITILVIGYFFLGIVLKFIWSWAPMLISFPFNLWFFFHNSYLLAGIGILIFFSLMVLTNSWQSTSIYYQVEKKIETIFYFRD